MIYISRYQWFSINCLTNPSDQFSRSLYQIISWLSLCWFEKYDFNFNFTGFYRFLPFLTVFHRILLYFLILPFFTVFHSFFRRSPHLTVLTVFYRFTVFLRVRSMQIAGGLYWPFKYEIHTKHPKWYWMIKLDINVTSKLVVIFLRIVSFTEQLKSGIRFYLIYKANSKFWHF